MYSTLDRRSWTTTTTSWNSMSKRETAGRGTARKVVEVVVEVECEDLGLDLS